MSKPEEFQWSIVDHACRICLGRVLMRKTFDGKKVYRCACCGLEREGKVTELCACGITLRRAYGAMNGGIRCVPNMDRTPENIVEIVAISVQDPKPVVLSGDDG